MWYLIVSFPDLCTLTLYSLLEAGLAIIIGIFIIVCIIIRRRSFGDTPVPDPRKSQFVTAHRFSPMDRVFIRWEFI